MIVTDLGLMPYRRAWEIQEQAHARVQAGADEQLLLVEHPPVVTLGRRAAVDPHAAGANLLATPAALAAAGVDLVQSDRGGDVTFHGPGQLVAYPVVRLLDHGLSVGGYVHGLEDAVIDALRAFGVAAHKDACAVGVWADDPAAGAPAKVCAIGVRVRRGATLHGLALNVTTDLRYFDLIVPCGIQSVVMTSLTREAGRDPLPLEESAQVVANAFGAVFDLVPQEITLERVLPPRLSAPAAVD